MKKGVSFIIPARNEAKYISSCIKSVIENGERLPYPYEIIVIDHNSTDNTLEIIRREKFPGRVISAGDNLTNVSSVRNHGAARAKGEVLVFLDGDVVLAPDWFKNFADIREEVLAKPVVTGSTCTINQSDDNWIIQSWYAYESRPVRDVNFINTGHLIISCELFTSIGGFDVGMESGEDFELSRRAVQLKGASIINNNKLTAIHLDFPKNLRSFFMRERWHGRGNWTWSLLTSKMTAFVIMFWAGIIGSLITLSPIILLLPFGLTVLMTLKRYLPDSLQKKSPAVYLRGLFLSSVVLLARGLSFCDYLVDMTKQRKI